MLRARHLLEGSRSKNHSPDSSHTGLRWEEIFSPKFFSPKFFSQNFFSHKSSHTNSSHLDSSHAWSNSSHYIFSQNKWFQKFPNSSETTFWVVLELANNDRRRRQEQQQPQRQQWSWFWQQMRSCGKVSICVGSIGIANRMWSGQQTVARSPSMRMKWSRGHLPSATGICWLRIWALSRSPTRSPASHPWEEGLCCFWECCTCSRSTNPPQESAQSSRWTTMGRVGSGTASSTRHGRKEAQKHEADWSLQVKKAVLWKIFARRVPGAHRSRRAASKIHCVLETQEFVGSPASCGTVELQKPSRYILVRSSNE